MHLHENRDASISGPTEQLSINNEGRFTLTKVFKICSEVINEKISRVYYVKKSYKKAYLWKWCKLILLIKSV